MRAKILPVFLKERNERETDEFNRQIETLKELYREEAEFLEPQEFGKHEQRDYDALVFPQLLGAVFHYRKELNGIKKPIIVLTSSFGTVEMWDWEIISYLREELGLRIFAPYEAELAKVLFRALGLRNKMENGCFLMFQESPGEGMQANIFKRFYWWEEECPKRIESVFGIKTKYKSLKKLGGNARQISDKEADDLLKEREVNTEGVETEHIRKAAKLYLAIRNEVQNTKNVCGVGSNCLNESFYLDTTPCLAWNWIFEYDNIMWSCEGDLVSLVTKLILYETLKRPLMMTNIYPFLVGMAALKHEKIQDFPQVEEPDNHALGVHCGYFGFMPESFSTQWTVRPKVLEIVNDHAIAIDCRMKEGPVTLAKIQPNMKKIVVIEAEIEKYVQYPGSDCRNGALIRYTGQDGHKVMETLASHHAIIIQGNVTVMLKYVASVFGFEVVM